MVFTYISSFLNGKMNRYENIRPAGQKKFDRTPQW